MGLDQYVYKVDREKEIHLSNKKRELEQIIHRAVESITLETSPGLKEKLEEFSNKWGSLIRKDGEQSVLEYLLDLVRIYSYGNRTSEEMQWEIFNNFSRFNNFLNEMPSKTEITEEFIGIAKDYLLPEEIQQQVMEYNSISEELFSITQKVAYWRKYHDLNDFMCEEFGADNCEEVELSLEDMRKVLEFIEKDGQDSKQVKEILRTWDKTFKYTYYPWW